MNIDDTSETKKRKIDDTKDVYPCNQCEYSGSRTVLNQHKQSKHEGIRYPCDHCEDAFTTKGILKKHKHEGIRYSCDQCEYAATQLSDLKWHKQSKHEGSIA